jgi:hypothetical protein
MFGTLRAVPRLGEFYLGICLTTEEKARNNLRKNSAPSWFHLGDEVFHLFTVKKLIVSRTEGIRPAALNRR